MSWTPISNIDHEKLLAKLDSLPGMRRLIKGWLKAGVMEEGKLFPTTQGTPQGESLSEARQATCSVENPLCGTERGSP